MRTQEELEALHREAEAEFKKYPGVVSVGYGYKEKAGQTTQQLSFRVYVREKKNEPALRPEEKIPSEFKGVPTDVIKAPVVTKIAECSDTSKESTLVSGISVTNLRSGPGGFGVGTLGFFATINGVSGPDNVVFVSNNHVLMANGAPASTSIYQPVFLPGGAIDLTNSTRVADIHKEGIDGNFSFAYESETPVNYHVDAATAKFSICMSSWCNTNCGTSFDNQVKGFHIGADTSKSITAVKRLQHSDLPAGGDYIVYKVGRRTGLTVGKVIEILVTPPTGEERIIVIQATKKDCDDAADGTLRFAEEGDSGAGLLNSARELIGIVFAINSANLQQAYADHIHPVLKKLEVTPITAASPHPAAGTFSDAPGGFAGAEDHTQKLRESVFASAKGREIIDLVEAHRSEVVQLVNHCRPVTVAWHRSKGPAFLSHAVQGVRDPHHLMPRDLDGVTREQLLKNMQQVLTKHGSGTLQEVLKLHTDEVIDCAERLDNPHQLLEQLNGHEKT